MNEGNEDARNKLILHNLRLVAHISKKYATTNIAKITKATIIKIMNDKKVKT